jgi:hypothetical protein
LDLRVALYDPQRHCSPVITMDDPGVSFRRLAVLTLWLLGYPEQALQRSHEALTLAQELSHSYSLVFALNFAA